MTAREVSERCGCAEKGWQADPECGGQVIEGDRSRLTAKDDVVSIDDSLRVALAVESGIDPNDPGFASPEIVKGFVRAMSEMGEDKLAGPGSSLPAGAADFKSQARDIQTNPKNQYYERYRNGDPDVQAMVRNLHIKAANYGRQ